MVRLKKMHHPGDIATTSTVSSREVSAAPITWMLILIGIGIAVMIVYYIIKLKRK